MSRALDGLAQLAQFLNPRTLKALRAAGATDPRAALAVARVLPSLLGRGPSLGTVAAMNATVLGDKPAVHDRRGTLSFKELDRRANRAAHLFRAQGLEGGDRVALMLRNGREIIETILGAQKVGIVCCPLNTWAKPKELRATLDQADARLLVYDVGHADQIAEAGTEGLKLVAVGEEGDALEGSDTYDALLAAQPDAPPPPFTSNAGSPKVVIHTSGTSGTPKGARRDAAAAGIGVIGNLLQVVPYRRDDVVYCPAPIFHSFGLGTITFATALGSTLVLPEKFEPERSLQLIELHRATVASFVPVMIRRVVALPDEVKDRYDVSSLRIVIASGSVLSEDLRREAGALFGDVLYDLYGSTEVGWVAIATPEDMGQRPKTVGKPTPGNEVAIFSPDGRRLPPGQTGEIYVKSKILFEGYTSGENRDQREGYMAVGDLGHVDGEGYLFVEARSDEMVVVGGENVYPIEVERVIEDIDGVEEVTVLGTDDEEYGKVLVAFVVGSADADQIEKVCRAELASYKVPRKIKVVDELPRTSTGKVLKRELTQAARD